jgi:hypothetical protein
MKRLAGFALCLIVCLEVLGTAVAQDAVQAPSKVIVIAREFLKPGKGGMTHEKAESAFVQAFARAKWPTHYVGMNSLSGKSRAIFLVGYDSMEAWEKDNMGIQKNPTLAAAIDHAGFVDGDLLDSIEGHVFTYNEDYSLHPNANLAHRRYIEAAVYHVRQGHRKEWDDAMKMVLAAYQKAVPDGHWACYEIAYGMPDNTFLFLVARTSLSEVDKSLAQGKDFMSAMGEDGMKKLDELTAASVESSETNLLAIDPRMSYVSDEWIKADPDFWSPKPAAVPAMHKKAAAQKEGNQ